MTPVGFFLLCALLLSGYLNDWSFRLLGGKAYLSTVCIVAVPLVWFMSGTAMSGFRDRIGVWWIIFLGLLCLGVPFSLWRSDSLASVGNYVFRSLCYYYYIVSLATNLRRCRTLMIINIICGAVLLLTCATFGSPDPSDASRFRIADSVFFSNSNELALQLLLAITGFIFLFYMGGTWRAVAGGIGIVASLFYIIKTGSRGCLLSAIILFIIAFWVSKRKVQFLVLTVPVLIIGLIALPSSSFHRFKTIFESDTAVPTTMSDVAAIGSAEERKELLKKGVEFTLTHPLFGVGMGQFPTAYTGEAEKHGKFAPYVGTHNSYTQVSSECGIPAFICYMAIIIIAFRRTHRIYLRSLEFPQLRELQGLSFCIFTGMVVYAIATFFFHMAYTAVLPLLAGQAVALSRAGEAYLARKPGVSAELPLQIQPRQK